MSVATRDRMADQIESWVTAHGAGSGAQKSELQALITSALDLDYVSESCRDGIQTGNHYQSVRLGASVTTGFRSDRAEILDQIDFRGRTVLDLGSNLGELSRAARRRGATRVVGVEYDEFFVAIARGLNVLDGTDGVVFEQGDIGEPQLYDEHFDIVLAFSVFQYMAGLLDHVCRVTDQLLVVETHKLEGNLAAHYIEPVAQHLPSFRVLGRSDWGLAKKAGARAVMAFARDDDALAGALGGVDERLSNPPKRARVRVQAQATSRELQRSFFSSFRFDSVDELLDAVRTTSIDLDAMGKNRDVDEGYRGWLYWFMYLKGYLDYIDCGTVELQNPFCRYLVSFHFMRVEEPGVDADEAHAIALRRFQNLEAIRAGLQSSERDADVSPIRLTVSDPPPPYPLTVTLDSGRRLQASLVDGWHRLFTAAICGLPELEADLVYEGYPAVDGRVEHYEITHEGTLRLDGWCLDSEQPWEFLELRSAGKSLARVSPGSRPDVAEGFPNVPHAGQSGFSFTCPAAPQDAVIFDLLPMCAWLPIGRIRIHRPADAQGDLRSMALATGLGEALDALGPIVDTAGGVAAVGRVSGELVASLLPDAEVVVVEGDPAQWRMPASGVGLVIVGDALGALPKTSRHAWLEALSRVLRPGGAVVLRDRGWLPAEIPPGLRNLTRLRPEPVEASETVILLRTSTPSVPPG
jgi:SAM-dependent methyltransferase